MRRAARLWMMLMLAVALVMVGGCQSSDGDAGGVDAGDNGVDAQLGSDGSVGGGLDGEADAAVDPPSRWLELPDAVNTRDVGGYDVAGGQRIRWRAILRGGQLSSLSGDGCSTYTGLGVASVMDLRQESERTSAPPAACVTDMSQVHAVPMPKILPPSEANYLAMMSPSEASMGQLFALLADSTAAPVYIHCVIGRDRASYAVALVLLALGADRATVLAEFALSNDVGITVNDDHLAAVLDEIDSLGGIEAYLAGLGVAPADLVAFRGWALE